jgi:hypothetical protein
MKTHYSEADLLETYYMQPGQSMPVMMHLASCGDCAARYERLERKLREAAACPTEKHETFWTRQRMLITRRIGKQQSRLASATRVTRVAAAAVFAFLLGSLVMYKAVSPALQPANILTDHTLTANAVAATTKAADDPQAHDAWQNDELKQFHSVVEWESWVETPGSYGDQL